MARGSRKRAGGDGSQHRSASRAMGSHASSSTEGLHVARGRLLRSSCLLRTAGRGRGPSRGPSVAHRREHRVSVEDGCGARGVDLRRRFASRGRGPYGRDIVRAEPFVDGAGRRRGPSLPSPRPRSGRRAALLRSPEQASPRSVGRVSRRWDSMNARRSQRIARFWEAELLQLALPGRPPRALLPELARQVSARVRAPRRCS